MQYQILINLIKIAVNTKPLTFYSVKVYILLADYILLKPKNKNIKFVKAVKS